MGLELTAWVTYVNRSEDSFVERLSANPPGEVSSGRILLTVRHSPAPDIFVPLLEVQKPFRGRGIGGFLLDAALKRYEGWDFRLRCSPVDQHGLTRDQLMSFYRKRGFSTGQGRTLEVAPMLVRHASVPRTQLPELRGSVEDLEKIRVMWG